MNKFWYDEENPDEFYSEFDEVEELREYIEDPTLIGYKPHSVNALLLGWDNPKKVSLNDEYSIEIPRVNKNKIRDTKRKNTKLKDKYTSTNTQFSRNQNISKKLKKIYKDICQVCRSKINIGNGECYSETHHIWPRALGGLISKRT